MQKEKGRRRSHSSFVPAGRPAPGRKKNNRCFYLLLVFFTYTYAMWLQGSKQATEYLVQHTYTTGRSYQATCRPALRPTRPAFYGQEHYTSPLRMYVTTDTVYRQGNC